MVSTHNARPFGPVSGPRIRYFGARSVARTGALEFLLPTGARARKVVLWRARIDDPFLACVHLPDMPPPADWGFDAGVEFPPHGFDVGAVSPPVAFFDPGLSGH